MPKPWFKPDWDEEHGYHGEDWAFMGHLEKQGVKLFIDHDLSWLVGHVGSMEYGHHMVPPPDKVTYNLVKRG